MFDLKQAGEGLTFKVSVLNVRIYEEVEGEVIWENSILDLHTHTDTHTQILNICITFTV